MRRIRGTARVGLDRAGLAVAGLVPVELAGGGAVQELVELGAQPDQVTERGGV